MERKKERGRERERNIQIEKEKKRISGWVHHFIQKHKLGHTTRDRKREKERVRRLSGIYSSKSKKSEPVNKYRKEFRGGEEKTSSGRVTNINK